jgi:hypothetical protein
VSHPLDQGLVPGGWCQAAGTGGVRGHGSQLKAAAAASSRRSCGMGLMAQDRGRGSTPPAQRELWGFPTVVPSPAPQRVVQVVRLCWTPHMLQGHSSTQSDITPMGEAAERARRPLRRTCCVPRRRHSRTCLRNAPCGQ